MTGADDHFSGQSARIEHGNHKNRHQSLWTGLKRTILAVAALVTSGVLIFILCVYLPLKYLPAGHKIVGIEQVKESTIELRTVSSSEVMAWGLVSGEGNVDEYSEETETENSDKSENVQELDYYRYIQNKLSLKSRFSVQSVFLAASTKYKDRHILIGDIHGQRKELQALLRKLKYNKDRDHLVVLGDFISKGPDSIGVIDDLIEAGAKCILGNHEYYVLLYYAEYHGFEEPHFINGRGKKSDVDVVMTAIDDDPEFRLARKLQPKHAEYINNCPVIYKLGNVPVHSKKTNGGYKTGDGVAVHAGLRWDLTDLNQQDPLECLQMRSYIGPYYNETTDDPSDTNAVSWSKIWNLKHKEKEVKDNYVVYYGHDARRGVKLKQWSKGLDHGCVKGDHLAAMVIWKEKTEKGTLYRDQVVKVPCADA